MGKPGTTSGSQNSKKDPNGTEGNQIEPGVSQREKQAWSQTFGFIKGLIMKGLEATIIPSQKEMKSDLQEQSFTCMLTEGGLTSVKA